MSAIQSLLSKPVIYRASPVIYISPIKAEYILMAHNKEQSTIKRCAIYSSSSVEKNNHDPFDSVSAQFMACAEFIGSQVGKGWRLVDTIDEGRGYSGSH